MKLDDWVFEANLGLSDKGFDRICDGIGKNLHVIGTCGECKHYGHNIGSGEWHKSWCVERFEKHDADDGCIRFEGKGKK